MMNPPEKHPALSLPPSPHKESYERFYGSLTAKLKKWLNELLVQFRNEGRIAFDPAVHIPQIPPYRYPEMDTEESCRIQGRTLEKSLIIRLQLDRGQEDWDWDLGYFPLMTSRGSFIYNGNERIVIAQLSSSPGVFFFWEEKNETRGPVKVHHAVAKLRPKQGIHLEFRKEVAPKDGPFRVIFRKQETAYLENYLSTLGFSEDEQKEIFIKPKDNIAEGSEKKKSEKAGDSFQKDIQVIARSLGLRSELNEELPSGGNQNESAICEKIRRRFYSLLLGQLGRAQVNRRIRRIDPTFAETSETITKEDVAGILKSFMAFINEGVHENDPWDLGNLKVRLVGDYLEDGINHWFNSMRSWIGKKLEDEIRKGNRIGAKAMQEMLKEANIDALRSTLFSRLIYEWIFRSPMSQIIPKDQNNLLKAASLTRKITYNGWGGIPVGHEREPRDFHWSHYGRICPLDTPQSDEIGTSLSLTVGARINELGIVETACNKIWRENGNIKIEPEVSWISPWDEVDGKIEGWIAFPDQREFLENKGSGLIQVHKAQETLKTVFPGEVEYIHDNEAGMFSLAANLIPFRKHNDPTRGVMACGFFKQALPLEDATPPRVRTGFERRIPQSYPFPYGYIQDQEMALGKELLTGYLPWKGWNFEDALVISKSASGALTSVHQKVLSIRLRRSLSSQEQHFKKLKKSELTAGMDLSRYDERGAIKEGAEVFEEDFLVFESRDFGKKQEKLVTDHKVRKDVRGKISSVEILSDAHAPAFFRITITDYRPAEIGDKLANRHGHKGVISKVYEDHEMPYFLLSEESGSIACPCKEEGPHCHLQILINPLSVISRMNIGQLLETREARSHTLTHLPEKVSCYDPTKTGEDRKLNRKVFVGEQYIMKLDQNAADRLHARSRVVHGYSAFVEQPLKGRRLEGGQRLGEMEVWALMAHNASAIIKELLTLKSDNPKERKLLFNSILRGLSKDISISESRLPEAFRTLTACLLGVGVELQVHKKDGSSMNPLEKQCSPEEVSSLKLSLLDQEDFLANVSKGEITSSIESGKNLRYKYHPQGLESEQIFGPLKGYTCACGHYNRHIEAIEKNMVCEKCRTPLLPSFSRRLRMGHIALARPVPNPFFLTGAPKLLRSFLGLSPKGIQSLLLDDRPRITFKKKEDAYIFLTTALNASKKFKKGLEEKIGNSRGGENVSQDTTSSQEDAGEVEKMIRELVKKNGGMPQKEFWGQTEGKNKSSILRGMGPFVTEVIRENRICGIDLIADLLEAHNRTKNLCLRVVPVIPPELRLRFKAPGRRVRPHDFSVLYRGILKANHHLRETADLKSDDPGNWADYVRHRRGLYLAVSRLFCNEKLPPKDRFQEYDLPRSPVRHSLSSNLEGKEGLFVGHLLGKRVDFSGRAVIVVDPTLPIDRCRIPLGMAMKLFYPHLVARMGGKVTAETEIHMASNGNQEAIKKIRPLLEEIAGNHNVLLNRQPTLHRLGMLGFQAEIGEGSVLAIPNVVTAGYNADFDGDQMAVFLPLTLEGKREIPHLFPSNHLWHPANGRFALSLAQDLCLGGYLNQMGKKKQIQDFFEEKGESSDLVEQITRFQQESFARVTQEGVSFGIEDLEQVSRICKNEGDPVKEMEEVITREIKDSPLKDIVVSGSRGDWKTMGYLAGTVYDFRKKSNLTLGLQLGEELDQSFKGRRNLVDAKLGTAEGGELTKDMVALSQDLSICGRDCQTKKGLPVSTEEEFWLIVENLKGEEVRKLLDREINQGIRGRITGVLEGKRGFGKAENLRLRVGENWEGVLGKDYERFDNHPSRKPPCLVGVRIKRLISDDPKELKNILYSRLYGRVLAEDCADHKRLTFIDKEAAIDIAKKIIDSGRPALVRSPLLCREKLGICQACYGLPLTRGRRLSDWGEEDLVPLSTRVGIIAAQAVGEPGTQMALRKKHLGGIKTTGEDKDISMGINEVRRIIQRNSPLLSEEGLSIYRDTFDHIYRFFGLNLAPVHFEMLWAGFRRSLQRKQEGNFGWIAAAARPEAHFKGGSLCAIAVSALNGNEDMLEGLKERVLIGRHLPHYKGGIDD